ncbi:MAG: dienelactone hydrolase family protein [Marmoricola sp.]
MERVREALAGRPDVTFETYPGADHAFDNPDFAIHHPEAATLAWERGCRSWPRSSCPSDPPATSPSAYS